MFGAAAVSYLIGSGAANALAILISGWRQRVQLASFKERDEQTRAAEQEETRRHSLRMQKNQHTHDIEVLLQKGNQDRANLDYSNDLIIQRETYPFKEGPGFIRRSVEMLCRTYQRSKIPLVLIPPVEDESREPHWANVRHQILADLNDYHIQGLIFPVTTFRPFIWPNPPLLEGDLRGLPTFIVQAKVGARHLHLYLSGCHIFSSKDATDISQPHLVMKFEYRTPEEYRRSDFQKVLNQKGEPILIPILLEPGKEGNPAEARRRMLAAAGQAVKLIVAKAMDTYYLIHDEAYDEQFNCALTAEEIAALPPLENVDLPLDLARVIARDLPYHLLHRAERSVKGNRVREAETYLKEAFSLLWNGRSRELGPQPSSELIVPRLQADQIVAINKPKHIAKAKEIIRQLPQTSLIKAELLPALESLPHALTINPTTNPGPSFLSSSSQKSAAAARITAPEVKEVPPTPLIDGVLPYKDALAYFVVARPQGAHVKKGAIRLTRQDGGYLIEQSFLDAQNRQVPGLGGKPYGRSIVVKELDREFWDALGGKTFIIVEWK